MEDKILRGFQWLLGLYGTKTFKCYFLIDSHGSFWVKSWIPVQMAKNFSLDLRTYEFIEIGAKFEVADPWWTKQ